MSAISSSVRHLKPSPRDLVHDADYRLRCAQADRIAAEQRLLLAKHTGGALSRDAVLAAVFLRRATRRVARRRRCLARAINQFAGTCRKGQGELT